MAMRRRDFLVEPGDIISLPPLIQRLPKGLHGSAADLRLTVTPVALWLTFLDLHYN